MLARAALFGGSTANCGREFLAETQVASKVATLWSFGQSFGLLRDLWSRPSAPLSRRKRPNFWPPRLSSTRVGSSCRSVGRTLSAWLRCCDSHIASHAEKQRFSLFSARRPSYDRRASLFANVGTGWTHPAVSEFFEPRNCFRSRARVDLRSPPLRVSAAPNLPRACLRPLAWPVRASCSGRLGVWRTSRLPPFARRSSHGLPSAAVGESPVSVCLQPTSPAARGGFAPAALAS